MLKTSLRWVAFAAVVLSAVWVFQDPKIEACVVLAGAMVTFLGTFLTSGKSADGQHQSVKGGSIGVQAGGDVTGDVGNKGV